MTRRWMLPAAVLALAAVSVSAAPRLETALFAGGCFWTMERDFELVPGVVSAVSGYAGGPEKNPTYDQVSSETTGHVETVKVTYDPARISYRALVERYWRMIDPTDAGGQACDRGPSYRAVIFATAAQKPVAEASKAALISGPRHMKVVVPVRAAAVFWPAEAYHQDFWKKNSAHYGAYRAGCGRDAVLRRLWGAEAAK